jgi:uncharacterized protein YbjT (DUF2867 family)
MIQKKLNIAVLGASGYVGGRLVPKLLEEGFSVRCLARNPEKLTSRDWHSVEVVYGDVLQPESLTTALKNIDVLYYLVHSMQGKKDFENLDIRAAHNCGYCAKEAGVKRIIYLGGLAKNAANLSPHLKSRREVGNILRQSGVELTELRASIIIGSGGASFEIIRDLVSKLPLMITPRWVQSLCEPISINNVLEYLLACLQEPKTINQILEIGGGEILSYGNMMKAVAKIMGKRLVMIPVPVLTPKLSGYWLNIVSTVPMSIALPLVEGLRNDSVTSDRRIREWIKIDLLSFEESVRKALEEDHLGLLASRWTEAENKTSNFTEKYAKQKTLQDHRIIESDIQVDKIFQTIQTIGGNNGWYYANWLWQLRGIFDRMIGGVGMRRGRRHPVDIRIGDAIDFWRVEKYEPGKSLKLKAEMKLPGKAWLEFKVQTTSEQKSLFEQRATFYPTNLFGYLYWYAVLPAHLLVFKNMAKNIIRRSSIH